MTPLDHDQKFIVAVRFELPAERWSAFLEAVRQQATNSLAKSRGCRRFDVCSNVDCTAPVVFLYEIYDDESCFKDHLKTEHFGEFEQLTRTWILSKVVTTYMSERLTS